MNSKNIILLKSRSIRTCLEIMYRSREHFRGQSCKNIKEKQFLVRLGSYLTRWIEMSKIIKTVENFFDFMLRDQTLHTVIKN